MGDNKNHLIGGYMENKEQNFIKKLLEEQLFNEFKDKKIPSLNYLEYLYPEYVGYLNLKKVYQRIVDYRFKNKSND